MVGVKMRGFDKLNQNLRGIIDEKRKELFLRQLVMATADLIKEYAPRDTRKSHNKYHPNLPHLENAIKVKQVSKTEYQIKIEVPYAKYLEYGTRYIDIGSVEMPKSVVSGSGKRSFRPFVRPAVWQMMNQYQDLVKQAFFEK